MTAKEYITQLVASGKYHFTTEEAMAALNGSAIATRSALNRLRNKREIAMPYRGFNVILSPEHRQAGCLPPFEFIPQLMEYLESPYYIGLLSAAEKHGVAHHRPQIFQVITTVNRKSLLCGKIKVKFTVRKNANSVFTETFNTRTGVAKVSSKETTVFDLIGYPQHCAGLGNVALILQEMGEELDAKLLAETAQFSPLPWAQRVGYMLDLVGYGNKTGLLAQYVAERARHYVPLSLQNPSSGVKQHRRWKVNINISLEQDL